MNFIAHAIAAVRSGRSSLHGFGAMMPDLANMLRLPSPAVSGELEMGIRVHVATDKSFHELPRFLQAQHSARQHLRQQGVRRGSALALGHIGVEMMLETGFYQDAPTWSHYQDSLRSGLEWLNSSPVLWRHQDATERMHSLVGRLLEHSGDAPTPERIAYGLERCVQGRSRLEITDADRPAVQAWVQTEMNGLANMAEAFMEETLMTLDKSLASSNSAKNAD
ncbi:MAG: hypothetical protein HRU17_10370 [Polyangiaceae bacterium]|nr:hypothetical protein [Polyangiaceae bacterium]